VKGNVQQREGRIIRANELTTKDQDEAVSQKQKQDSKSQNGSGKECDFKGGKGKNEKKPFVQRQVKGSVRRTATTPSGDLDGGKYSSSTITVSMKDKDDDDESEYEDDQGDNDTTSGQDEKSVAAEKPPKKKEKYKRKQPKTIKAKLHRNPVSRRGCMGKEKPRGVIDPGIEIDVIGGPGWQVLSKIDNLNAQLDGALTGMGECSLPLVTAVTAYDHRLLGTVLLGAGCAGYDERSVQTESLFNSHDLRKHNVIVHDTTKRDGGEQRLEDDGIHAYLDFVDNKTLSFKLWMSTASELEELKVHWLSPRRLDLKSKNGNAMRRSPAAVVPTQAPWKERLGNPPEEITEKTLQATTRLCESPVEMDKREAPRQHRKKRVQALHPKRIEGRTDSDTFFSSIKLVRGYVCIQIFFVCLHKFTFVRVMRKEPESHGAYQDLIREVGASNTLLTDNAQTETGKKWMRMSRDNATRQIKTVPHNQNQNNAERNIQDVNRRTIMTLCYALAPLVFWCYWLGFIVDCLNHTAEKELDFRTAMEKMFGNTPDISMFCFIFGKQFGTTNQLPNIPRVTSSPEDLSVSHGNMVMLSLTRSGRLLTTIGQKVAD
jgi:hypothetical protein